MSECRLICGDAIAVLGTLPAGSARTCITSPPYFGLRAYLPDGHADKAHEIGLEETPDAYVARLVEVFRAVRRVLADDGTLWLNLGDSFNSGSGGGNVNLATSPASMRGGGHKQGAMIGRGRLTSSLAPKQLLGIPWRVAFALQADGWILRSDIIWAKPNPMPESVRDRPTKSHEYLFLLSKRPTYYYDADTVREESAESSLARAHCRPTQSGKHDRAVAAGHWGGAPLSTYGTGRNRRSVWSIATRAYKGAHFAVMPELLVEPCVLAGSAAGDTVLDPFVGSGTVPAVAMKHGRKAVGIDLNAAYLDLALARTDVPRLPLRFA